jgi:hypothetical protein
VGLLTGLELPAFDDTTDLPPKWLTRKSGILRQIFRELV